MIGAHSEASHLSFSFFACAALQKGSIKGTFKKVTSGYQRAFKDPYQGVRQSKTTSESALAGIYPSKKTFLHPQEKHSRTVSPSWPSL